MYYLTCLFRNVENNRWDNGSEISRELCKLRTRVPGKVPVTKDGEVVQRSAPVGSASTTSVKVDSGVSRI